MDFASAYVVYDSNERAKGICLTNMGIILFWNNEYLKAAERFKMGSMSAMKLIIDAREEGNKSQEEHYV